MHVHILTKVWDQKRGNLDMHIWSQRGACVCIYVKGLEEKWGVKWMCINVLIYAHILTKVWDQERVDWITYTEAHRGGYVSMQLCKGVRGDEGSQVDMHACPDVCTHSMGPEEGDCDTHVGAHMFACNYKNRMEQMLGSQEAMHTCIDAYTHSNQGVGPDEE